MPEEGYCEPMEDQAVKTNNSMIFFYKALEKMEEKLVHMKNDLKNKIKRKSNGKEFKKEVIDWMITKAKESKDNEDIHRLFETT